MIAEAFILLWPLYTITLNRDFVSVIPFVVVGLVFGLSFGLVVCLGVFVGVPCGILLIYILKKCISGASGVIKGFFRPWEAKSFSFLVL